MKKQRNVKRARSFCLFKVTQRLTHLNLLACFDLESKVAGRFKDKYDGRSKIETTELLTGLDGLATQELARGFVGHFGVRAHRDIFLAVRLESLSRYTTQYN